MGNMIGAGLFCCCNCCCKECSEGIRKWLGNEKTTKFYYFLLVVIFVVPSIFIFFYLNQWKSFLKYFQYWLHCPQQSGQQSFVCIGSSAIFRLSLCLTILFTLMFLIMLLRTKLSMIFNQGCFCFKYLFVIALFIGSLWIDNNVFESYSSVAQWFSVAYMCIQSIILIDMFYLAGIRLVSHYDKGQNQYAVILIILTVIVEGIAIMLNILSYIIFTSKENCPSTLWLNILMTLILIILPIIQFLHFNEQNSLLTTSFVSLFISYLMFISQYSYAPVDDSQCDRMSVDSLITDIICSSFFFILTMCGSIMGGTGEVKAPNNVSLNEVLLGVDGEANKSQSKQELGKEEDKQEQNALQSYTQSWKWAKWHFHMCLASIYVSMLITNWGSADLTDSALENQLNPSNFGFWVRFLIGWLTFFLYTWTMIAPRVCPSRDFRVI